MGKRELIALLNLSSWCFVMVEGSSSRCHRVVCSLSLWYFLIILTNYFYYNIYYVQDLPWQAFYSFLNMLNIPITNQAPSIRYFIRLMRGSRKFCQERVVQLLFFLVDYERDDPSTT